MGSSIQTWSICLTGDMLSVFAAALLAAQCTARIVPIQAEVHSLPFAALATGADGDLSDEEYGALVLNGCKMVAMMGASDADAAKQLPPGASKEGSAESTFTDFSAAAKDPVPSAWLLTNEHRQMPWRNGAGRRTV